MQRTNIRPTNHVCRSPIETHEAVVSENLVWKVNAENKLEKPKAKANGTVLPAQWKVLGDAEKFSPLAKLSLFGDSLNVITEMHKEAP